MDFVTKPWANRDFMAKIRKALSDAREADERRQHVPTLADAEKESIRKALRMADGNLSHAAEMLGITRQSLYRRMEKLGIK